MKNLLACLAMLAAFNVTAQIDGFQMPYNPDSEPDGYIGVGDVLELLAMFGAEWNASDIYLSNDNSSMTMYVGELKYHNCVATCSQLNGNWRLSSFQDFAPILDSLADPSGPTSQYYWVYNPSMDNYMPDGGGQTSSITWYNLGGGYPSVEQAGLGTTKGCYCSTHERPKVNFSTCTGDWTSFNQCIVAKVDEGWYPFPNNSSNVSGQHSQAFWRWAE